MKDYWITTLPDVITKKRPFKYSFTCFLPMMKVPYTDKYEYNPTDIAAEALREQPLAIGWLLERQEQDGSYPHNYDIPHYKVDVPWTGGLSQALAASALIRYGYLEEAQRAIDFMLEHHYLAGMIFEKANVLILNGWIYGIFALKDAVDAGLPYRDQYLQSLKMLRIMLPQFIMKKGWTYYEALAIPSTPFYHRIHIEQMSALAVLTRDKDFDDYAYAMLQAKYPRFKRLKCIVKKHGIKTFAMYMKVRKWRKSE